MVCVPGIEKAPSSRTSHRTRHSLQFQGLHFWRALKELANCILLGKPVPHVHALFPFLFGHVER